MVVTILGLNDSQMVVTILGLNDSQMVVTILGFNDSQMVVRILGFNDSQVVVKGTGVTYHVSDGGSKAYSKPNQSKILQNIYHKALQIFRISLH